MLATGRAKSRVFPAYAGMSPPLNAVQTALNGFPRLRGDEPVGGTWAAAKLEFSPPTRG